jgi:hypothetical protein
MTLVVSWIARDSRKASAVYVATDSCISWNNGNVKGNIVRWNYGRKVYYSSKTPDILAFWGEAFFAGITINQIIDADLLFNSLSYTTSDKRFDIISKIVENSVNNYPFIDTLKGKFNLLHCSRDIIKNQFKRYVLSLDKKGRWKKTNVDTECNLLLSEAVVFGSGKKDYLKKYKKHYEHNETGHSSRAVFQCFSETLKMSDLDVRCGGAPQLVGIYNGGSGRLFGTIFNNKRFNLGLDIEFLSDFPKVEWRDELFQRCDKLTKERFEYAQQQPRPNKIDIKSAAYKVLLNTEKNEEK